MSWRIRVGSLLFGLSIALFGIQHLSYAAGAPGPPPGPPWTAGVLAWAYITGAILIVCGAGVLANRWARPAAIVLGAMLLLRVLLLVPGLATEIRSPGKWTSLFELLAMCGVSLVLVGALPRGDPELRRWDPALDRTILAGRILFAVSLVVFAIQHFMYPKFVATLVPAWIPARLFWAWFAGFAFAATAISLVANRLVRLSATLLAIQFFSWVLVLHIPRAAAAWPNGDEWTSMLVALAMTGSGLILAGSPVRRPTGT